VLALTTVSLSLPNLAQIRAKLGWNRLYFPGWSLHALLPWHVQNKLSMCKSPWRAQWTIWWINFIFAGDFAQLHLAMNAPRYILECWHTNRIKSDSEKSEAAVGKALWHQVTTVVILRQNMRQDKQSPEDNMLRTALENMRYKSCTPQKHYFLRSRIAGKVPMILASSKPFRNVSIITAFKCSERQDQPAFGCERSPMKIIKP